MKQVQIDFDLFLDLLSYFGIGDEDLQGQDFLALDIQKKLSSKLDKIISRQLFTQYKRMPTGTEREKACQEYLNHRGNSYLTINHSIIISPNVACFALIFGEIIFLYFFMNCYNSVDCGLLYNFAFHFVGFRPTKICEERSASVSSHHQLTAPPKQSTLIRLNTPVYTGVFFRSHGTSGVQGIAVHALNIFYFYDWI